jgi:hypothetical protein
VGRPSLHSHCSRYRTECTTPHHPGRSRPLHSTTAEASAPHSPRRPEPGERDRRQRGLEAGPPEELVRHSSLDLDLECQLHLVCEKLVISAPPTTVAASRHRGREAAGGSSPSLAPAGRRPAHSPRMAASPRRAGPEQEGQGYRQFVHHGMRPWLRQDVYDYCGEKSTPGDDGRASPATSTVPEEHQKIQHMQKARSRLCHAFGALPIQRTNTVPLLRIAWRLSPTRSYWKSKSSENRSVFASGLFSSSV